MANNKKNETPTEEELFVLEEGGGIVDKIWNFFSSMKLGIFLLIIIAVVAIVGTLIKPDPTTGEYIYYRSWWFRFLLFMLTMNLLICSLSRIKLILKTMEKPKADFKENFVKNLKNVSAVKTTTTTSGAETMLEKVLNGKGYRVTSKRNDEKVFLAADKGRFGVWGSFLSHIAFIIIIIGAIIGNLFGFSGYINALEGETFNVSDIQGIKNVDPADFFQVRVDDFRLEVRPNGMPKDYFSDLVVLDNGKEIKKTIEVNDPLKYNGIVFYQASYGQVTDITGNFKGEEGMFPQDFSTYENGFTRLMGTNLGLKVAKFIPDYDPAYGMETKSPKPNNPAVVYAIFRGQETIAMDVVKLNTPIELEGIGKLEFNGFDVREYTGLQVKKDPGVPIVWLGCGLLVFGITLSFVVQHRKIWAVISEVNGKAIVDMGGIAMKNKLAFEKEFNNITQNIEDNK